ncbi:MAG TPA: TraR/DksA C4-type zinc finger protein [Acidimicrobiales bacterium]|nr:TraR/DksA C4-type zinc finger protein [Acidimicrobiales bacterium]
MTSDQASLDSRDLLQTERDHLLSQLEELGYGEIGDTGLNLDANFADSSQVTAERGETETLVRELRNTLKEVEAAIGRIEAGTYGICEKCGNPIEPARLEAMPATRFCIAHASSTR